MAGQRALRPVTPRRTEQSWFVRRHRLSLPAGSAGREGRTNDADSSDWRREPAHESDPSPPVTPYAQPMLELRELTRRFGDVVALDNASFVIRAGEAVGFIGRNGAGKTTAMRIVLGLLAADHGEVRWNDVAIDRAARQRIGYMPEERGLYAKARVIDQLTYFSQLAGYDRPSARVQAKELLTRLGIPERASDKLKSCRSAINNESNSPQPWSGGPTCWSSTNHSPGSTRLASIPLQARLKRRLHRELACSSPVTNSNSSSDCAIGSS